MAGGSTPKFKRGDVVHLRSGGPSMTVIGYPRDESLVACIWFDQALTRTGEFWEDALAPGFSPDRARDESGRPIPARHEGGS